jgi:hypothetical protein
VFPKSSCEVNTIKIFIMSPMGVADVSRLFIGQVAAFRAKKSRC